MVEFHQKSTCGDAANLTNYLNSRGISTSCNGMSLQDDTEDRVITCQYFVMLITKGYQESKEYQDKFNNNYQKFQDIHNTNVTITAVIDEDCNKECEFSSNHWLTRVKLRSAQQVFKETSPNWMEEIESIISKSIANCIAAQKNTEVLEATCIAAQKATDERFIFNIQVGATIIAIIAAMVIFSK